MVSRPDQSSDILEKLTAFSHACESALALAQSRDDVLALKVAFFGKKGKLTEILRALGTLDPQVRARVGEEANRLKQRLSVAIDDKLEGIETKRLEEVLGKEAVDITLPGHRIPPGHLHPLRLALDDVVRIFTEMGFSVAEGAEIETEAYNFEALNIPAHHPARDMQNTFYLPDGRLLRTHTSPVQIHFMQKHQPPFQMIAPGKVYRRDSDVSHTPMFHQVEGLVVTPAEDPNAVSMAHLKGTLEYFIRAFFNADIAIRLRPSYFPFTEPSCEVDIECVLCNAAGCPVCKESGWLEVMGAGMVHPKVFQAVGYDPEAVVGFAFGMGIERLAMLKYRIPDIRLFYENDPRFLEQF
jgi:phenylalanyl-tRNA synthetase alpha chain